MKKLNYLLVCLFLSMTVFVGCKSDNGGDPEPTAEQQALEALQGTWKVTDAQRDNSPLEGYENMTMTISSNKTLSTAGGPSGSIFPTGSFTFIENSNFKKIRVDNVDVELTAGGDSLVAKFKLDVDGHNAARIAGLDGSYTFKFSKQ